MKHKEIKVASATDLKDGEMKQVDAGGTKILLARVNGQYHAVGATCPHYGAPLAEGALMRRPNHLSMASCVIRRQDG